MGEENKCSMGKSETILHQANQLSFRSSHIFSVLVVELQILFSVNWR